MKCCAYSCNSIFDRSPSMRREWIEINVDILLNNVKYVSLHAEGVD